MKKILVTTDLSVNSKSGIRFALQLAKQTHCELHFYHAVQILKPTSWSDGRYKNFQAEKIAEFTARVTGFVKNVSERNELPLSSFKVIVQVGTRVPEMIIETAKKLKAAFVCMGTHGAGRIQKILGNIASELITTSEIPVIIVPKNYRAKPISRLFFACDFAMISKEMPVVEQLRHELNAELGVFHYDYLLHVQENRKKLEKKSMKFQNSSTTFHFKRQEIEHSLSKHLEKDIQKEKPSLVILFTKQNRNWFDRFFMQGETTELAFHAKVPLLTFRKKL
jgi:nucleotide-binding universal stress UspA family protein